MIDLNAALVFVSVVRRGSFIDASRALEIPRSTVSARIAALEDQLGYRLLRRTTRKLALTGEGQVYFDAVRDAVDALLSASSRKASAGGHTGTIRLTASPDFPTAIIRRAVLAFRRDNPRVRFDVLLTNEPLDFVEHNIDLALRGGDPGGAGLVAVRLCDVPFGLFASPDYLSRKGTVHATADLAGHDLLVLSRLVGGRRLPGLPIQVGDDTIASNSMTLLKELTLKGAGIAALPRHLCAMETAQASLVLLLPEWTGAEISPVHLVFPSRRDISARVRAFADNLRVESRNFHGL